MTTLKRLKAPSPALLDRNIIAAHLRIDYGQEQLVTDAISEAVASYLDGAEGYLGRPLLTQTWCLELDQFPRRQGWGYGDGLTFAPQQGDWPPHVRPIVITFTPFQEIESIVYVHPDGETYELQSTDYILEGPGTLDPLLIWPASGTDWPATQHRPASVIVTFKCGYGGVRDLPHAIRQAALMIAATWFQNRESVLVGNFGARPLPQGAADLLAPYRIHGF